MMGKNRSFLYLFATACLFSAFLTGVEAVPRVGPPQTVVLDGARLLKTKKCLLSHSNAGARSALKSLIAQADELLPQGPWSVTNKKIIPPNGTVHDYASQAPYWWPSNTSDGCPYIQRDGVRNPEVDQYTDHDDRGAMFNASYILSLAWFYTGEDKYARKAGDVLRTWFINPDTRMNPNLNHAQIIPCANDGRSIGIIDFSQEYTSVLDAAAILASGAPGWTSSDIGAFKQWNVDFLDWLENSPFGIQETAAKNNHGTFALMQSAGIALFVGDADLAKNKSNAIKPRIDTYITANGSQPQELARTRSYHYSTFNLVAYTRVANIARKIGVDLWGYTGAGGQSIQNAINFIIPAATQEQSWPYPELEFDAYSASDIVHAAADEGNPTAREALGKVPAPPGGDLWPVRPAVEQLDALSGSS